MELPSPLATASVSYITNANGQNTVSCTVQFALPAGATFAGGLPSYTLPQQVVTSVLPKGSFSVASGVIAWSSPQAYGFISSPTVPNGQNWTMGKITVGGDFGQVGQGSFIQIITPSRSGDRVGVPTRYVNWDVYPGGSSFYGVQALDSGVPYPFGTPWPVSAGPGTGADNPSQNVILASVDRHRAEAQAAFEKCFRWEKVEADLHANVGDWIGAATDYAVFLAQSNRGDDAKLMYYYVLREINPNNELAREPYPFVVVFDPSPAGEALSGDVWQFSQARFEAACLMVKVLGGQGGDDEPTWLKRVSQLAPDWLYPVLYTGWKHHFGPNAAACFDHARAMAKTADERALVERVAGYISYKMPKTAPKPQEARNRIPILHTSHLEMARAYPRLIGLSEPDL